MGLHYLAGPGDFRRYRRTHHPGFQFAKSVAKKAACCVQAARVVELCDRFSQLGRLVVTIASAQWFTPRVIPFCFAESTTFVALRHYVATGYLAPALTALGTSVVAAVEAGVTNIAADEGVVVRPHQPDPYRRHPCPLERSGQRGARVRRNRRGRPE